MISLKAVTKKLQLEDENGKPAEYQILKFTAAAREEYLNDMQERLEVVFDAEGNQSTNIKNHEGMRAILLSRCLKGPDGKLVSYDEVQSWPSTAVDDIHEQAQEFNGLTEAEGSIKND